MPFTSRRAPLDLSPEVTAKLETIRGARTAPAQRVERARILLAYASGNTVSAIARALRTNRPKVERCLDKALQFGPLAALDDLQRSGRPPTITPEARAWLVSLACRKPTELGYAEELWTTRLLARHARQQAAHGGTSESGTPGSRHRLQVAVAGEAPTAQDHLLPGTPGPRV